MKFSGKMCFKMILKVTKKQSFTLSLEDTFFEKPQGECGGRQFDPPFLQQEVIKVRHIVLYGLHNKFTKSINQLQNKRSLL